MPIPIFALRGDAAAEDAPDHALPIRGGQTPCLRRPRAGQWGLQSLPKLVFPGGALIGDDAGFLVASRIKGSHAATKTGMLAAEAIAQALATGRSQDELAALSGCLPQFWLHEELHRGRNFKPWMAKGSTRRRVDVRHRPAVVSRQGAWTLRNQADHLKLKPAAACAPDRLSCRMAC